MKNIRKIINISSIIFLSCLILLYGYRLIYYYKLEHQKPSNQIIKFSQKLINNKGIEGMNFGLQSDGDAYLFGPKSTDNYLYYLGRMWRIIGIDENKNISLITDEIQTILPCDDSFNESNINTWLNITEDEYSGIFEKSLKDLSNLVKKDDKYVTLLDDSLLQKMGQNSYIINESNFWIINKENNCNYINNKGEIISDIEDYDTFGVKPIITLNSEINYVDGNGTKENPYLITLVEKQQLADTFVGEYLNYNDYLWRVIETNDDSLKIALEGYIDAEDIVFSSKKNIFDIKDGIGEYLNKEFYESLSNNDYIVENNYYVGPYSIDEQYSYLNTYDDEVKAHIGLYKIGDFFINNYNEFYTLTPSENSEDAVYVVNKNKKVYADFITSEYKIRPVMYLDSKIFILSGNGTKESPYEIGR